MRDRQRLSVHAGLGIRAIAVAFALACAACTYPTRTAPLDLTAQAPMTAPSRTWRTQDPDPQTLAVIVASGGGTRAAAFMLGVLRALDRVCMPGSPPCGSRALDHVDLISTVSGSSVTAGYWVAHGKENFGKLENHLKKAGFWDLFWRYLNPKSAVGNWFPARAQIDVLVDRLKEDDAFDGVPFGDTTFGELPPRPQLILNATDMGEGNTFSFTPQNFYYICSELSQFRVAEAVAGSAAFPFAFGALSIRNYSYDRALDDAGAGRNTCRGFAEAPWIDETLMQSADRLLGDRSEFRRAERLRGYSLGDCALDDGVQGKYGNVLPRCKEWLHLLDGGVADNLGISEPFWLTTNVHTEFDPAAPYRTRTGLSPRQLIDASYAAQIYEGRINRIVFLTANVRSDPESKVELEADNPGWLAQAAAVTGGSIDAVSDLLIAKLSEPEFRRSLEAEVCEYLDMPRRYAAAAPGCSGPRVAEIMDRIAKLRVHVIPVDFEFIGRVADTPEKKAKYAEVRKYFQSIPTTWWLPEKDIDNLLTLPGCLLADATQVYDLLNLLRERFNLTDAEIATMREALADGCTYDAIYDGIKARKRK